MSLHLNARTALACLLLSAAGCISVSSRSHEAPGTTPQPASGQRPHRMVVGPEAPAPFLSSAVRTGNLIFLSGQLGIPPGGGQPVSGGAGAETRQILDNIDALLQGLGLSRRDVVKCTVFLTDMADYGAMNEVYSAYFSEAPPARSAMAVSGLARGASVEIECIAAVP